MTVFALGLNHASAPLDLRGGFAIAATEFAPALRSLAGRLAGRPEAAIVATCNRTELYVSGEPAAVPGAIDWLAAHGRVPVATLRAHTYLHQGLEAARHAFRVASGLDSMVLGEPQILGQMKTAVRHAAAAGTLGCTLHQMFQRSFAVAKVVRSRTAIGAQSVSFAAAAVRVAERLFENPGELRVLFVGAGEMVELCAVHFAARRPQALAVANRSAERAAALAARIGAEPFALAALPQRLAEFDIVVSGTASTLPIIGLGAVEGALRARRGRPMLFFDLAVPRDVEPEVARLDSAYLYTLDDLGAHVQRAGAARQASVAAAQAIVEHGVGDFERWLERRQSVPLIQALNARAEAWRAAELARARRRLARGDDLQAVMEGLSVALERKLLHGARASLRASPGDAREPLARTVERLFLRGAADGPAPGA
jgi:glutamyl-tRNA reductase